jgi:hypothetical protein
MATLTMSDDGWQFFQITENLEYGERWIREDQLNSIDQYAGFGKYEITYDRYKTGYMLTSDANLYMMHHEYYKPAFGFNANGWWEFNGVRDRDDR